MKPRALWYTSKTFIDQLNSLVVPELTIFYLCVVDVSFYQVRRVKNAL